MRPILPLLGLAAAPAVLLAAAGPGASQPAAPIRLAWPVACQLGATCEIQHYVDDDPGPGVKDYRCGARTYDGHDGVDIRLPDMTAQRRGVMVLAAADGKVLGIKEGRPDVSIRAPGAPSVKGIECGNGLAIEHAGGFRTDYCHMARGSILVKAGDVVKAGDPLGRVGLSGDTEFPHLHFTVRKDLKAVDPFAYGAAPGTCGGGVSLWRQTAAYAERVLLTTGFVDAPPTLLAAEDGELHAPGPGAGALIAYARTIGLKPGDVQSMVLKGPTGAVLSQRRDDPQTRSSDLRMMFIGQRKPPAGWAKGRYTASFSVTDAAGKTVLSRTFDLTL